MPDTVIVLCRATGIIAVHGDHGRGAAQHRRLEAQEERDRLTWTYHQRPRKDVLHRNRGEEKVMFVLCLAQQPIGSTAFSLPVSHSADVLLI
jgi:hypothetical protein